MAVALRSTVGLALRRAAAALAPASSRLSSTGAASANTRVGTRHNGNGSRSMFDPKAYSRNPVPANPELDKFDLLFGVTAFADMIFFGCLMDGDNVLHYFGWCKEGNASRQPRMSGRRSRR